MPFQKILFRPGINVQRTQLLNEGGWSNANCIRFREGMPETLGGWQSLGVAALVGVPRGCHAWATLAGVPTLAVGTNVSLYVMQPTQTNTPTNPFTTTNGFQTVLVTDPNTPSVVVGSIVNIQSAGAVGGIQLGGTYPISQIVSPTSYYIIATSAATSSATGGGTPTIQYSTTVPVVTDITPYFTFGLPVNPFATFLGLASVGVVDPAQPSGLQPNAEVSISSAVTFNGVDMNGVRRIVSVGPGQYRLNADNAASGTGAGGGNPEILYGVNGPASSGSPGFPNAPSAALTWTLDNFGEQLIANPRGGNIYVWLPATPTTHAVKIAGAVTQVNAIFVSNGAEQIIALGGVPADGGAYDPMLVSWCNSADYNTWIADPTNNAGNFQLTDGSQLMWGGRAGQQNLIWSDTALYAMQFIGGELIYGFQQLGTACGLIGPQSAGIVNTMAAWMSKLNFMSYNGTVQVIDCPVRDAVFKNIDTSQSAKIICAVNSQFNEMRWDYPSLTGTGENDSYVIWNYVENTWTLGSDAASGSVTVARTAWQDVSAFGNPVGFDANGNSYYHEVENYYLAGTSPMPWFLESGFADISLGEDMMFFDWLIPDQILTAADSSTPEVNISVASNRYTSDTPTTYGPFTVTPAVESVYPRGRGRQVSITFTNVSTGNAFWRLGAVRVRLAPDGRN